MESKIAHPDVTNRELAGSEANGATCLFPEERDEPLLVAPSSKTTVAFDHAPHNRKLSACPISFLKVICTGDPVPDGRLLSVCPLTLKIAIVTGEVVPCGIVPKNALSSETALETGDDVPVNRKVSKTTCTKKKNLHHIAEKLINTAVKQKPSVDQFPPPRNHTHRAGRPNKPVHSRKVKRAPTGKQAQKRKTKTPTNQKPPPTKINKSPMTPPVATPSTLRYVKVEIAISPNENPDSHRGRIVFVNRKKVDNGNVRSLITGVRDLARHVNKTPISGSTRV